MADVDITKVPASQDMTRLDEFIGSIGEEVKQIAFQNVEKLLDENKDIHTAYTANDVAVLYVMGGRNVLGADTTVTPANTISAGLNNVYALSKTSVNINDDATSVKWDKVDTSTEWNLGGTITTTRFTLLHNIAKEWQAYIDGGNALKLPDLYIVMVGDDDASFYEPSTTGNNGWSPTLPRTQTNLFQKSMRLVQLVSQTFQQSKKNQRVLGLLWDNYDNDANTANNTAPNNANAQYRSSFNQMIHSFRQAVGSDNAPIITVSPDQDTATKAIYEPILKGVGETKGNYYIDLTKASQYNAGTTGFGLYASNGKSNLPAINTYIAQYINNLVRLEGLRGSYFTGHVGYNWIEQPIKNASYEIDYTQTTEAKIARVEASNIYLTSHDIWVYDDATKKGTTDRLTSFDVLNGQTKDVYVLGAGRINGNTDGGNLYGFKVAYKNQDGIISNSIVEGKSKPATRNVDFTIDYTVPHTWIFDSPHGQLSGADTGMYTTMTNIYDAPDTLTRLTQFTLLNTQSKVLYLVGRGTNQTQNQLAIILGLQITLTNNNGFINYSITNTGRYHNIGQINNYDTYTWNSLTANTGINNAGRYSKFDAMIKKATQAFSAKDESYDTLTTNTTVLSVGRSLIDSPVIEEKPYGGSGGAIDAYPKADTYTKTEVDTAISTNAYAKANTYTKAEVDTAISTNAYAKTDTYSKTEVDTNTYTKSAVDTLVADRYTKTEVDTNTYTKTAVDGLIGNTYTKTEVDGAISTNTYAKANTYTKTEVDTAIANVPAVTGIARYTISGLVAPSRTKTETSGTARSSAYMGLTNAQRDIYMNNYGSIELQCRFGDRRETGATLLRQWESGWFNLNDTLGKDYELPYAEMITKGNINPGGGDRYRFYLQTYFLGSDMVWAWKGSHSTGSNTYGAIYAIQVRGRAN